MSIASIKRRLVLQTLDQIPCVNIVRTDRKVTCTFDDRSGSITLYRTGAVKRDSWNKPLNKTPLEALHLFVGIILKQLLQRQQIDSVRANIIRQQLSHTAPVPLSDEVAAYLQRQPKPPIYRNSRG